MRTIPRAAGLGFHFCFGTFGGWPAYAPATLGPTVALANAVIAGSGRRVDWVYIPTLDRAGDEFYARLAKLETKGLA